MTVSLITLGVIAALAIIALLGLAWLAYVNTETARTNGYDQGYDDARKAAADYTTSLEGQLANSAGRYAKAKREHDQQLQDADRRIAIYAGRSYTRDELTSIRRAAKQLKLAALTYSQLTTSQVLELSDQARHALTVCGELEQLAQRIEDQLEGTAPTALPNIQQEAEAALLEAAAFAAGVPNGKSWLVYGPEGCGKTRNAQAIADALGLTEIVDDWQPGDPAPITKALVLTNDLGPDFPPFYRRVLSYDQAMSLVAAKANAKQGAAA
jgi:ATPase subunit of ABC transporter with duplicated ATPase domains